MTLADRHAHRILRYHRNSLVDRRRDTDLRELCFVSLPITLKDVERISVKMSLLIGCPVSPGGTLDLYTRLIRFKVGFLDPPSCDAHDAYVFRLSITVTKR